MKKVIFLFFFLFLFSIFIKGQQFNDQINLNKYMKSNAQLVEQNKKVKVVFIGNSITENWVRFEPEFFNSNDYIGRGISGQTSPQMLSRFRQDVVNLKPQVVVINAGTNDIAENTGTYSPDFTLDNIKSMADLATSNGIKVILSSVLPVGEFPWSKEIKDVPAKVISLNTKIKAYADSKNFPYIDYFAVMHDDNNALMDTYGSDGVHPNKEGYAVMQITAKRIIDKVFK